jgi:hypothetical protein
VCNLTPSGRLSATSTIGGLRQSIDLGYSWSSDQVNETVVLTALDPITFQSLPGTGGENIEAFFEPLTSLVVNAGAPQMSETLDARFEVPEPFSIAVLGFGLFGLAIVRHRRA